MKRGLFIVMVAICLVSLLAAGCTQPTQGGNETATPTAAPASGPRTITDLNGNMVTLPENIDSVAVLTSPPVQIMYVLGAQDKLSVVTQQTQKARHAARR